MRERERIKNVKCENHAFVISPIIGFSARIQFNCNNDWTIRKKSEKKRRALLVKNLFMIDITACLILILFLFQFEACCFGKFCDAIQDRLDACLFW